MAYDLDEQEQLENLKAWWAQYGNLVTWLVIVGLLAFAAWNGWQYWQRKQAAEASVLYETVQKAIQTRDVEKTKRATADLTEKFGGTTFASLSALQAAKVLADANDLAGAKAQLQWVMDRSKVDEYRQLARLRLAGVLLDEKAYDESLKLLSAEVPEGFAGVFAERKGDVLVAQNKLAEARDAYKLALEKTDAKQGAPRQLIQYKLDALGGA